MEVVREMQRTFSFLEDSVMRYFDPRQLVEASKVLKLNFNASSCSNCWLSDFRRSKSAIEC